MSRSALISLPTVDEIRLIERGRAAFFERFPEQAYDDSRWSIRHLRKAGSGQGNVALYFTRIERSSRAIPLPARFSDVMKAHLAINRVEPGTMVNRSCGARWLWEAIRERLGGNEHLFSWQGFNKEDAERAEDLMLASGMNPTSVYRRCVENAALFTTLASAGVIAPVEPVYGTPRSDSLDRMTIDGQQERMEKLPSDEAIGALSDLYAGQYNLAPFEQLLACVPALMFCCGHRIIEALQLSTTPLRVEGGRSFLYYFRAKGKGKVEDKVALTELQAVLAQEAIDRAIKLTRDVRLRARELVNSPDIFPLPAWAVERDSLTLTEVADLLCMPAESVKKLCSKTGLVAGQRAGSVVFNRSSLQDYLQQQRKRMMPESIRGVVRRADGTWLPLDEALFICFKNDGHSRKASQKLVVKLISQQQVGTFLGGHGNGLRSVFDRVGLLERDGQPININSHQIRHYVTTKASSAGIPDALLVRWQRRAHERDLQAYKHLTSEERLKLLREHVRSGRLKGEIASMYFNIAPDEREIFLESVVQAMHFTHLGFCVHDFNTSPCPSAMNCVKRCGSYLFDKKDEVQRERLIALKLRNSRALEDAQAAQAAGNGLMVDEWVRELKATDEGLQIILASEPGDGVSTVAPFAHSPSKFQGLK